MPPRKVRERGGEGGEGEEGGERGKGEEERQTFIHPTFFLA